jgi:hypothetical protein
MTIANLVSSAAGEEQQPNDADPAWVLAIAYRLLERQTEPLQLIARQKRVSVRC